VTSRAPSARRYAPLVADRQDGRVGDRRRRFGWGTCALLVAASAAIHAVLSYGIDAPWIAPDEEIYGLLGRSLVETGHATLLGSSAPFYGFVYPAFVGVPLSLLGRANGIHALQLVQPLIMSATGFVAYGWARRLVSPRLALLAATLTLAIPAFAYTGLLMTEVAFYPLATLALLAVARALEEPVLERQALAVTAILIASLTRIQGLVLVPALVTSVVLFALFERSTLLLRRFALTLALLSAAALTLVIVHLAGGGGDAFGAYTTAAQSSYSFWPALKWVVWHAGDAFLLVAGVPLLAGLALAADAARGAERSRGVRALVATGVSYGAWTVVQVGIFSSHYAGLLLERNLITLAPPLFVAFVVWLSRGAPRPRPLLLAAVPLVPVVLVPARVLTDPAAAVDAFTALPLAHLDGWTSAGLTRAVWICGAAAVVALAVALPRRRASALAVVVVSVLLGASAVAHADVHDSAARLRDQLFGTAPVDWVDRSADGDVAYVFGGSQYWNAVWAHAFSNTRIAQVLVLPEPIPDSLPPHTTISPRFDGILHTEEGATVDTPYALASDRYTFAGTPVSSISPQTDIGRLTLWRVSAPLQLRTIRDGFLPNGDIVGKAVVDVFACGPGQLQLTLLGKQGTPVTLRVDGNDVKTIAPPPGSVAHEFIPAPPTADGTTHCRFELDSKGLLGSTVVQFVPASG
jgi:Dolichyl-phosphate-mannose-protein mannosyltransferase